MVLSRADEGPEYEFPFLETGRPRRSADAVLLHTWLSLAEDVLRRCTEGREPVTVLLTVTGTSEIDRVAARPQGRSADLLEQCVLRLLEAPRSWPVDEGTWTTIIRVAPTGIDWQCVLPSHAGCATGATVGVPSR